MTQEHNEETRNTEAESVETPTMGASPPDAAADAIVDCEVATAEAEAEAETENAQAPEEPEPEAEPDPVEALQSERDALRDALLRARAEFDNARKRTAKEMESLRQTASERLMRDLLPVLDNLERALQHKDDQSDGVSAGVEMTAKQLQDVLASHGLEAIEAVGQPFDPETHEALAQQPSAEHPADTVALEYERGYRLGKTVLRHAKVVVSSGPAAAEPEPGNT